MVEVSNGFLFFQLFYFYNFYMTIWLLRFFFFVESVLGLWKRLQGVYVYAIALDLSTFHQLTRCNSISFLWLFYIMHYFVENFLSNFIAYAIIPWRFEAGKENSTHTNTHKSFSNRFMIWLEVYFVLLDFSSIYF